MPGPSLNRHLDPPVTVLRELHPVPGHESELEAGMRALIDVALTQPGYLGASVTRPLAPGDPYRFIYKFDALSNMDAWHRSPVRADLYARVAPHVQAERLDQLEGLATWLNLVPAGGFQPPKWRTTFVSWLAIFPTALAVNALLDALAFTHPPVLRTLVLTAIVVPTVAYGTGPLMGRWLQKWMVGPPKLPPRSSDPPSSPTSADQRAERG